jgi:hypothetical protein
MVVSDDKTNKLSRLPKLAEYFTILAITKVASLKPNCTKKLLELKKMM